LDAFSAEEVFDWDETSLETLERDLAGRELYDHFHPDIRSEVILHETDLYDEMGNEIRVYTEDGYLFPRREPYVDPHSPPCGILLNLRNADRLYGHELPDVDDANFDNVVISIYPQAFLHQYGHMKASGTLSSFNHVIRDIKSQTGKRVRFDPDQETWDEIAEDEDEDDDTVIKIPLVGVSSQFYNELSHRVAADAGSHEVQQGHITAALAGSYANTLKDKKSFAKKVKSCDRKFPFGENFSANLSPCSQSRASIFY
jgi:hypothetical protein